MNTEFTPYEDADEEEKVFLEEFFCHDSFNGHRYYTPIGIFGPELEYSSIPEDWRVRYEPVLAGMRIYITGSTSCAAWPDRPAFEAHFSFCCEETVDRLGDINRKPDFFMGEDWEIEASTNLTIHPSGSDVPIRVSLSLSKKYGAIPGQEYSQAPVWLGALYCFVYDVGRIRSNAWVPLQAWREGAFNRRLEQLSRQQRLRSLSRHLSTCGIWLSEPLPYPSFKLEEMSIPDQILALEELKAELESMLPDQRPNSSD